MPQRSVVRFHAVHRPEPSALHLRLMRPFPPADVLLFVLRRTCTCPSRCAQRWPARGIFRRHEFAHRPPVTDLRRPILRRRIFTCCALSCSSRFALLRAMHRSAETIRERYRFCASGAGRAPGYLSAADNCPFCAGISDVLRAVAALILVAAAGSLPRLISKYDPAGFPCGRQRLCTLFQLSLRAGPAPGFGRVRDLPFPNSF